MSHLCFLTPLCSLPWLPSPDIPAGPPSAPGRRRLLRRAASSSQERLAADRKPLTESSGSDSVGGRQGGRSQVTRASEYVHAGSSGPARKSCSPDVKLCRGKKYFALEFLSDFPLPADSQTPPEDCVPMRGHTRASFPTCSLDATPPPPVTLQVLSHTHTHTHTKGGEDSECVHYDGGLWPDISAYCKYMYFYSK